MIAVGKPIQQSVASGEAEIMAETGDLSIPCIYPPSCIANEHTCNFHNRDVNDASTSVKSYFRNWPYVIRTKKDTAQSTWATFRKKRCMLRLGKPRTLKFTAFHKSQLMPPNS